MSEDPSRSDTLTLSGKGAAEWKGVFVEGRLGETIVGQFLPLDDPLLNIYDCPPGLQSAAKYEVVYGSGQNVSSVTLQWVAPDHVSTVVFWSTFVRTFSEFWVDVKSAELEISASGSHYAKTL
uniref:Reelin domain-containing protein n=1 Tax=Timema monikensis TaxID=170555 RepID=A0A7R9HWF6_9NEOP|nr:unnamed protein product [Timema monikensis]